MCAPSVIQRAMAGLSRRDLLRLVAGTVAALASPPQAIRAETASRSVGI
jgi:hypothetical protein